MINTEIFSSFRDKSRVLIYSKTPPITKCLVHILDFHEKEFDYIFADNFSSVSNQDFVILETNTLETVINFQPNIVLISTEIDVQDLPLIMENIVSGGVLVFPQNFENEVENSNQFFRKLSFDDFEVQEKNGITELQTEMGNIPLSFKDETLVKNLKGIKLISQQFKVLEEDFYEPLMSFE